MCSCRAPGKECSSTSNFGFWKTMERVMRWYFRDISDDPSEKELTQQDQFNNDEVALAEAIVRETIQNSTDAQAEPNTPVRVSFAIRTIEGPENRNFFDQIVADLSPDLRACGMPVPGTSELLRELAIVLRFHSTH